MRHGQTRKLLVVCIISCLNLVTTYHAVAVTDQERIVEARVALERFDDCNTALDLLSGVGEQLKKDPVWIYYSAKANLCAGKESEALKLFESYDKLVPKEAAIQQQLAELRYKGKSAWRANFCVEAQKVVADWHNDFRSIRTENTGTTSGDAVHVVHWKTSLDFRIPFYGNNYFDWGPELNQVRIHNDPKKSHFYHHMVTAVRTGIGRDIFAMLESEMRKCLAKEYDFAPYDRRGSITLRGNPYELTGNILRGQSGNPKLPVVYAAYGKVGPNEFVSFAVGPVERLENEIVK